MNAENIISRPIDKNEMGIIFRNDGTVQVFTTFDEKSLKELEHVAGFAERSMAFMALALAAANPEKLAELIAWSLSDNADPLSNVVPLRAN